MRPFFHRAAKIAVAACLCFSAVAAPAQNAPTRALNALIESTWQRDLKASPLMATYLGDTRYNDKWPDISTNAFARESREDANGLKVLSAIKRSALLPKDQLNYDLFKGELESRLARDRFKPWSYEMTMREGPQTLNEVAELMPFDTAADYAIWIKRLKGLPAYLDQYVLLLRQGLAEGRTQPRALMQRALPTLEAQAGASAETSPFFDRFKNIPDKIAAADRERLVAESKLVIGNEVIPAYKRFTAFFRDEYLPRCRETSGIWDTPDGLAFYTNRANSHTTTKLTPEEIHQIGLAEVSRIRAEMQKVMDQLGFKGTRQEFFEKLRTDPQFYYTNPEDLFRAYVYTTKMIEPELPKLFGKLYRTPVGVKPIPMTSAPNTTTAYYSGPSIDGKRAGYFYTNLYKPEVRPKYEIEVLTVHEAIPGHHLQIALAQEQGELPKFRRFAGYTAYIEGWALYSERLGFELGLYKDPYSHIGQLTYDMWRAVRLVVDTGIHVKKWTRQQAIDYFKDNAAKTETDIVNEIDRYIGWPGQALAYKIGQLKILELRARAEKTLGAKFDIRAFHDMVLESGAIPLNVLESRVDAWIARQRG